MTLRSKLIGGFLLPTFIILALFGIIIYGSSRQELEDELGRRLVSIGQATSSHLSQSVDAKQIGRLDPSKKRVLKRLHKKIDDLKTQTGIERAFIFSADLNCIVDTDETPFGEKIYVLNAHQEEIEKAFNGVPSTSILFAKTGFDKIGFAKTGGFDKIGFVPIHNENKVVALIGIVGSAQYFEILNDLFKVLAALFIFGFILVIAIASFLSKRITDPINELVQGAQNVGRGDFHEAIKIDSKDEIGFLGNAFENMRIDILQRDEQMRMMLSGIAHEVRNPLGGMALFLGLLKEDLEAEKGQNQSKLGQVDKIQRELFYLEDVVSDFLDFAKNTPLEIENIHAKPFIDEIIELLAGEAAANETSLQGDIPDDIDLTCDSEKIRSAIINIVRNACQACGESGEVVVSLAASDGMRCIIVKDNGCGMDAETIKSVLTPFYTTKEQGSGLGLALANRIIGQHGGNLEIKSEKGIGTEIFCSLPFDDSIQKGAPIPEGWLG